MRGISSIDGRLFFGWIPKAQDDESKYDEKYIAKWQTTLTGSLIKPTMNVLIDIIYDWLESDEVKEIYNKLKEENDVGYWDNPTKIWYSAMTHQRYYLIMANTAKRHHKPIEYFRFIIKYFFAKIKILINCSL